VGLGVATLASVRGLRTLVFTDFVDSVDFLEDLRTLVFTDFVSSVDVLEDLRTLVFTDFGERLILKSLSECLRKVSILSAKFVL
jgi:hypothetical protein